MSATTSAATGRCFGIQRVCQVWERLRSALYARRARAHHHRLGAGPARRGPVPRQSDAQLLAVIRADLARSPFHGEGHRKVHARLRMTEPDAGARLAHGALPEASGRREDPRRSPTRRNSARVGLVVERQRCKVGRSRCPTRARLMAADARPVGGRITVGDHFLNILGDPPHRLEEPETNGVAEVVQGASVTADPADFVVQPPGAVSVAPR